MTFTRVRDCLFLAVGLGGLVFQQVTQTYNATLVGAYLTLLTAPGFLGVVTWLRNGNAESSSTGQPASSSPPSSSPPPPLSASSARDGGDP